MRLDWIDGIAHHERWKVIIHEEEHSSPGCNPLFSWMIKRANPNMPFVIIESTVLEQCCSELAAKREAGRMLEILIKAGIR